MQMQRPSAQWVADLLGLSMTQGLRSAGNEEGLLTCAIHMLQCFGIVRSIVVDNQPCRRKI